MALQFTAKTLDYAKNPRNQGEIETPTAVGEVSNPDCGDSTKMYLVVDENGVITDITFETFGCAAAVASSSIHRDGQRQNRGRGLCGDRNGCCR